MTPEIITAIAAVVIAVAALAVSVWQGFVARRHNMLSVRPHLELISAAAGGEPIRIYLENQGLGPAFVTEISFTIDKKPVDIDPLDKFLSRLDLAGSEGYAVLLRPSSAISAGSTADLLVFTNVARTEDDYWRVITALRRLGVIIRYRSIYDEHFGIKGELFDAASAVRSGTASMISPAK